MFCDSSSSRALLLIAAGLCAPILLAAQQAPVRGFAADALAQRTQLEERLRTVPDTARLRQYQRMGDGTWADGLLMEMLASELIR